MFSLFSILSFFGTLIVLTFFLRYIYRKIGSTRGFKEKEFKNIDQGQRNISLKRRSTYASRFQTNSSTSGPKMTKFDLLSMQLMGRIIDPSNSNDPEGARRIQQALTTGNLSQLISTFQENFDQDNFQQQHAVLEQLKKFI